MPAAERAEIFAETADRKGLPQAIVEKDFWVCWVLMHLFSMEALSGRLVFKGGTSLSKIFHAINRFLKISIWLWITGPLALRMSGTRGERAFPEVNGARSWTR
jgi:hypothetical protein